MGFDTPSFDKPYKENTNIAMLTQVEFQTLLERCTEASQVGKFSLPFNRQLLINLRHTHHALAERIRLTDADPSFNEDNIERFYKAVFRPARVLSTYDEYNF